jgi:Tfp pilus assembly protein FimT
MFKKKENGFSLVELSVAAAVAIGLAVVAVAVVSGTATSVSSKGTSAASVETCTISEALAKSGGNADPINCVTAGTAPDTNFITLAQVAYSKYGDYSNMLLLESDNTVCNSSTFVTYTTEFRFKQSTVSEWTLNIDNYSQYSNNPRAVCSFAGSNYNAYEIGRMGPNYTGTLLPATSYNVEVRYYSPSGQVSNWYNAGTFITGTGGGK